MTNYRPKPEQRALLQVSRLAGLLILTLVQNALLPAFWHYRINLVLITVLCWTLIRGLTSGVRWAFYGGLSLDLLTPDPLGAHLLAISVATLIVAAATEEFPRENLLLPTLSVVGGTVIYSVILAAVSRLAGNPIHWAQYPLLIVLPETLLNVLAALPVYAALRYLDRRERARGWA